MDNRHSPLIGSFDEPSFKEEVDGFPDLETFKKNLQNLKNLSHLTGDYEAIKEIYFKNCVLLPHIYEEHNGQFLNSAKVYRVRNKVGLSEDLNVAETYSHPKIEYTLKNNRANIIGAPAFYGSWDPKVAIAETKLESEEFAYLGTWKIECNRKVLYNTFIYIKNDENLMYSYASSKMELVKAHSKQFGDKANHFIYLYEFLSDLFIEEQPEYNLGSWIGNQVLYGKMPCDYMTYASKMTFLKGICMAFSPLFVSDFMKLESVIKFKVNHIDAINFSIDVLDEGVMNALEKVDWLGGVRKESINILDKWLNDKQTVLSSK